MSDKRKEWCKAPGVAACTCEPGQCMAVRYKDMIADINLLMGYGIDMEDAAAEIREKHRG